MLFQALLFAAQIAYTHAPDGGPPWPVEDVHIVRRDGSGARALTSDGKSHDASWSPDGKRILFVHDIGQRPVELCVMDADGGHRRVLRVIEPVIYSAAWSPDGQTIAVSAAGSPARGAIYLLSANGKGKLRLIIRNGWTPSWSPDGKKLAFTVEQPRGRWSVHVADADGANDVRLTPEGVDAGQPAWSPDGRRIAFNQFTDLARRQQIFLMNADGSGVQQLTRDEAWSCEHPSWSPDGTAVVAGCRSAGSPCGMGVFSTGALMPQCTRRLFLSKVNGSSQPVQVTDHDGASPSFR